MQKNLVIVESPAKAKTIEKFLGADYKVLSSYGHIRDLKKRAFSIDTDCFKPQYEIPAEKAKLVGELKKQAKQAETVWLASDEDREGEAISWHLFEVLGLKPDNTRRIVFHEITKSAILQAIEHPRQIDLNLVNAQQARRVLDRIVGFKLSPVLWKKVRPSLSAGRVQSVAVRLVVEREREIARFTTEESYRVVAVFTLPDAPEAGEVKAEMATRFASKDEAKAFLQACAQATFSVGEVITKPQKRSPSAPFTTSTLQQEAAHKLGFTVSQTMMVAQRLYESGHITYMRTDSMNLSSLCLNACAKVIKSTFGEEYHRSRQYHTKSKGAQEAHEAIRPTYMDKTSIEGTAQEKRLYDLIWKRTIASQMQDALIEKTTATINISDSAHTFVATGEVVKFDGFLNVYMATADETGEPTNGTARLPLLTTGQALQRTTIEAQQRFSQHPPRYNEASLVKKLEELGIGRPSTYAPTISTIQQRGYVVKGEKEGEEKELITLTLQGQAISEGQKPTRMGSERGKLLPTDVGMVVNDFLLKYFPEIMDYNFTAQVEKEFDDVAEGKAEWTTIMKDFYSRLEPQVEQTLNAKEEHRVGERLLGTEPKTGKPVSVKIGRFGSVVQIGAADDKEKPRFAKMKADQSIDSITLEEALDLFKLPREVGEYEGLPVSIGAGRFGPYVHHDGKYASLPKGCDPMEIGLEEAIALIEKKRADEAQRHIRQFDEEPDLEILKGPYGPYIAYKGTNYKLPKTAAERVGELTAEECLTIIKEQADKPKATRAKRTYTKKK